MSAPLARAPSHGAAAALPAPRHPVSAPLARATSHGAAAGRSPAAMPPSSLSSTMLQPRGPAQVRAFWVLPAGGAPLESRLAHLAAAEGAVSHNYSFPKEPARFTSEVLPHITRLIVAIGLRPLDANVRAVLAVLVRSDDKNDSPSDRFVYSLMQVNQSSFFKWKAAINTLRSNGG